MSRILTDVRNNAVRLFIACAALVVVAAYACSGGGCQQVPASYAPVVAAQGDVLAVLTTAYATDASIVDSLLASNYRAQRRILIGDVERVIIVRDYVTDDGAVDPDAIRKDVADPKVVNILTQDVRDGLFTTDGLVALVNDYAVSAKLSNGDQAKVAVLGKVGPVRALDAAYVELVAAMDTRRKAVAGVFASANANNVVMGRVADPTWTNDAVFNAAARAAIVAGIKDPTKRDAALELLTSLSPNLPVAK